MVIIFLKKMTEPEDVNDIYEKRGQAPKHPLLFRGKRENLNSSFQYIDILICFL
jgi:hypothetical protein